VGGSLFGFLADLTAAVLQVGSVRFEPYVRSLRKSGQLLAI
jgi:hypothetical protein